METNPEEIIMKLKAMIQILQEKKDGRNEQPIASHFGN